MASRMKIWTGLTAVGVALVTINFVPPRPPAWSDWPTIVPRSHEEVRAEALEREIQAARLLLQRRSWADSLSELAVAGTGPVVSGPEALRAEELDGLRRQVAKELAMAGSRADGVALGVFVQPRDRGESHRSIQGDQRSNEEWYLGRRDGRTYCLSVLAVHPRQAGTAATLWAGNSPRGSLGAQILGPCRFVAQFGTPGPDVVRWLEAGGTDYARALGELPTAAGGIEWRRTRTLFGLRLGWVGRVSVSADQCRAGIAEGCADLFLNPGLRSRQAAAEYLVANSDLLAAAPATYDSPFGPLDDYLLSDLVDEFGVERFGRFWTSDRPVAQAFEEAFGMDVGTWMATWAGRELERYQPGPGIRKGSLFGTGLLLSLFAVAGGLWARRHTVA